MPKGDREMLKADIEDGYTKIANLLIEALSFSNLSSLRLRLTYILYAEPMVGTKRANT